MSIFSRSPNTPPQTPTPAAEAGAQAANPEQAPDQSSFAPPRNAPPGVVPPPAAPVYSMRPAEADRVADSSMSQSARMARDAQLRAKSRPATPRAGPVASPAQTSRKRQLQQAACVAAAPPPSARQQYDPLRAAQTGLLKLAWSWQQAGSAVRAIHTYMELISRYPDSAAASAAIADLVELSDALACEGQFHTALSIYEELEQLGTIEELA